MATSTEQHTSAEANPRLFAATFFFAPLIASIIPRLSPAVMVLVAFVLLLAAFRRGTRLGELFVPSAAFFACLAVTLYVLITVSWAWNSDAGFEKASLLLGATLLAFAAAAASARLDKDKRQLRLAGVAFVTGASLGALYLLIELLTKGAITQFAMNVVPALQPDDTKRIVIESGEVTKMNLSRLNQNVTLVMLHLWPGLLMLSATMRWKRPWLAIGLFAGVLAAAILVSKHDSSQAALLGSALVFVLAWNWARLTLRTLAALWCLGFLLVLPLSFATYNANLHLSDSLPVSYKARLIIWQYTAEQTLEHPWLGVGAMSTREKDKAGVNLSSERPEGFVFKRTTGHHAHNLFLQTWYELGAVGAALLALAGALVLLRSTTLPKEAQPFAAATFAAFAVIAAFGWGTWQTWWICAAGLAAIYVCFGARVVREIPVETAADPQFDGGIPDTK